MPADIRNFFGGKPAPSSQEKPATKTADAPKSRKSRVVVIEDSDEDEPQPKKATPKKATPRKKKEPSPKVTATTASDYFGNSNKPKRTEPAKSKHTNGATNVLEVKPTKSPKTQKSSRKTSHSADFDVDDLDNDDDVFGADYKKSSTVRGDDYEEESDEDDKPLPVKKPRSKGRPKVVDDEDFDPEKEDIDMKYVDPEEDFVVPDDDEAIVTDKPAKSKKTSTSSKKRKSDVLDDEEVTPKKAKTTKAKSTAAKKAPKVKPSGQADSVELRAINDDILIEAPAPPEQDPTTKKYNFGGYAQHTAAPAAAGSKELPRGEPNCLAGLTFVLTGVNETLGREEGQQLIKQYGGKIMSAPSKNTSYVVLGSDAGPKKLETIQKFSLKAINEDGLFELIRRLPANGGSSAAAEAYALKQAEEEKKIRKMAAEMEIDEPKVAPVRNGAGPTPKASGAAAQEQEETPLVENRLWTVKYAPTSLSQICGNKTQVDKLQRWLKNFQRNKSSKFKLAGADGTGIYRAVIISGPPGIGKTTAAHLVAKTEGYDIVEMNASDTRSKKLLENGLKGVIETTSLLGYFAGDGKNVQESKKKLVLIMDEVDGMSAGDRGGVGALAAVCKKTSIPMILICNDRKLPKMRPFDFCTYDMPFRRPTVDQIRSRVSTIAFREGMKMPAPVVNALIEGSGQDIRQVVNMISSAKLDEEAMDFDNAKEMSKAWEKHVVLKPWDITGKILSGVTFAPSSKMTLNDKIELYFNDHEFSPLMLQENYLGTNPQLSNSYQGKEKTLKVLELAERAAASISDGDLVDRMIHGSQQQWSLMPTHAVFSFVRPASFMAGNQAGNQTRFTSWLGKNSNQQKLTRMVKEIQGHMRLRTSGDRHEVRQQYIPLLWERLVDRLQKEGKESVPEIIDLMDSYFLTKDDFDAILELGVGPMDMEKVKLETQAKATFTRLYNQQSHPLPFMKASNVAAPKKQVKEQPDLEEAVEASDEGEVVEEAPDKEDEDLDISKDKYIKAPKKKKAPAAKGKGKKREAASDDDEDEPPVKKGKAAAKGKGRGKK